MTDTLYQIARFFYIPFHLFGETVLLSFRLSHLLNIGFKVPDIVAVAFTLLILRGFLERAGFMRHLLRIFKLSLRISQKEPKQSHPVSAELISSVPIIYYANKKGDRTKICRLFLSNILLRRCFWSRRCCRCFR